MPNIYYNYSGAFLPGTLARAEAVAAEYTLVQKGFDKISNQGTDTGTANHYAFTTPGYPVAAYQDGNNVQFKALNTNTGASDVNVNGIGVVPLTRFNGAALLAGDVSAGSWYIAVYQVAFGAFTIISPAAYTTFAGTISGAAPANKVGLTAAGGSATSAIPIDATLAIDQAIIPTWTGLHTFNGKVVVGAPASGVALTVTGVAGASAAQFLTTGVQIGSPTGGDKGSGTLNVASGLYVNGTLVASGAIVTSITGTANQIAASASTGAVTLSMPQNVIIPTPASGAPLTVNGSTGNQIVVNASAASTNAVINLNRNAVSNDTFIGVSGSVGGLITGDAAGDVGIRGQGNINLSANSGASTQLKIANAGNVSIAAPSAGVALTVNGLTGSAGTLQLNTNNGANTVSDLNIQRTAAGTANSLNAGANILIGAASSGTVIQTSGNQTELWQYNGGWNQIWKVDTNRSTTINAAAAGITLQVNQASTSNAGLRVTGPAGNYGFLSIQDQQAGNAEWFLISGFTNNAANAGTFSIYGNGNTNLNFDAAGGVWTRSATGSGQGAGTFNAQGLYVNGNPVYAGIPQNLQTGNYTCVLADANKHVYKSGSATLTFTIPANGSVAYPIGTAITFAGGNGTGSTTLAITTDTLNWAPSGTSGSRTLTGPFVATAIKITSTFWQLTGVGIS